MEPKWEELGRELEKARGDLTANEVAGAVGITGKQLRNYERALATSGRPGASRIIALADYYEVDPGPWLALAGLSVPNIPRRVAHGTATVGGSGKGLPRGRGSRRGEDDALVNEERKMVGEAAALLAQAAAILAKIAEPERDD